MIHIGTNSLSKDSTSIILENILNIVQTCKNYGVNNVLVSGVTYRHQFKDEVREINTFLNARQFIGDYTFIDNDNINEGDLWNDKLHLNNRGTKKLANNFIIKRLMMRTLLDLYPLSQSQVQLVTSVRKY